MKISNLLNRKKFSLSFEVFPPKTDDVYDSVQSAAKEIAKLKPSFMSITYGAGGGTSKYTLEMAKTIKDIWNVSSVAHLTCVSSTKDTVFKMINDFKEAGIENIMALRGDIPQNAEYDNRLLWHYNHATELIYDIKSISDDFCIGGACYPEVHPESANQKDDIKYLKEKADAGCDFFTTQMFFDNNLLYNFSYKKLTLFQTETRLNHIYFVFNFRLKKQKARYTSKSDSVLLIYTLFAVR